MHSVGDLAMCLDDLIGRIDGGYGVAQMTFEEKMC